MKLQLCSWLLLLLLAPGLYLVAQENKQSSFNKSDFYNAMAAKNEDEIDKQLDVIKLAGTADKAGFEGALLMKKAGIAKGPKKKLDLFKAGHKKLESALKKDSSNVEFHFLRLMIQENAPSILGYKRNLESDRLYIKNNFSKMPAVAREAAINYSKASKILKPADL